MATREVIMLALYEIVIGAWPFRTSSRRLKLWSDTPASARPALFMAEHDEIWSRQSENLARREMAASLFIYTDAHDPKKIGASEVNDILDAVDAALAPAGRDLAGGKQTLGGLVSHAFIDGEVFKDPGDLDGDGLLIVPLRVLLP